MRAPAFWDRPDSRLGALLSPLQGLYAESVARRVARPAEIRPPVPVLCVGNLVAGGAGKTPTALALASLMRGASGPWGVAPHFLSRGHGGRMRGPSRVRPEAHGFRDVGDEPLLLARAAPTWIARDRAAAARAALADGATALILDDGHQNPSVAKDLSLVVVDGATGFGNGRVLPAGPLREPVAAGLARADGLVVVGADKAGLSEAHGPSLPVFGARLLPTADVEGLAGQPVLAFCGLGRPEKFFTMLRDLGCVLIETVAFADHHPYTSAEIAGLIGRAEDAGAVPLTTAKDFVRLPATYRPLVRVVEVCLIWDHPAAVTAFLRDRLGAGEDWP